MTTNATGYKDTCIQVVSESDYGASYTVLFGVAVPNEHLAMFVKIVRDNGHRVEIVCNECGQWRSGHGDHCSLGV